jgi:hypothetical protein
MSCHASVTLVEQLVASGKIAAGGSSPAAEEGTHAHAALEAAITDWVHPSDLVGGWYYDRDLEQETADAIAVAYEHVLQYHEKGATIFAETKLEAGPLGEDIYGTADIIVVHPQGTIEVIDYKHGKGVPVSVHGNRQAQIYLLLALDQLEEANAEMGGFTTIIQPRCVVNDDVQTVGYSKDQLNEIKEDILRAAEEVDAESPAFQPGDTECKFCPAKGLCPALANKASEIATQVFEPVEPVQKLQGGLPAIINAGPEALTDEQISIILDHESLIRDWISAVHKHAHNKIQAGGSIPNWTLKNGRKSRNWDLSDEEVIDLLRNKKAGGKKLGIEAVSTRKAITPAQAEKKIKGKVTDRTWKAIEEHIKVSLGSPVLAPVSDPRPDTVPAAEEVFAPVAQANPLDFLG